jgi:hypothetical protein
MRQETKVLLSKDVDLGQELRALSLRSKLVFGFIVVARLLAEHLSCDRPS